MDQVFRCLICHHGLKNEYHDQLPFDTLVWTIRWRREISSRRCGYAYSLVYQIEQYTLSKSKGYQLSISWRGLSLEKEGLNWLFLIMRLNLSWWNLLSIISGVRYSRRIFELCLSGRYNMEVHHSFSPMARGLLWEISGISQAKFKKENWMYSALLGQTLD